jgi:RNA polymerase sigma-70 factor (ECF subfamily)
VGKVQESLDHHSPAQFSNPGATQQQVRVIGGSIAAKQGGEGRDLDDQDLMARLAAGDEEAFEALLDRLEKRLYNRFLRVLRDREEAADLTQQAFLVVLRDPGAWRPERGTVDCYLFGIARILLLKRLRQLRRDSGEVASPQEAREADPLDVAIRRQQHERLLMGIGRLTPVRRTALVLKEVQGLEVAEVARRLEMPVNTVKSHLRRARMQLRRWTGAHFDPEGRKA